MQFIVNHYYADDRPRSWNGANVYLDQLRAQTGMDGTIEAIEEKVTASLTKHESCKDFYLRMLAIQNEAR
jgi:hypothetical protein